MKRVVILGRGASGKSTLAIRLGSMTGLPVIELDKIFWQPGLVATSHDEWRTIQERLLAEDARILDGDLGPYDVVEVRLRAADTIIFVGLHDVDRRDLDRSMQLPCFRKQAVNIVDLHEGHLSAHAWLR
jgi:hypothetical protein